MLGLELIHVSKGVPGGCTFLVTHMLQDYFTGTSKMGKINRYEITTLHKMQIVCIVFGRYIIY